MAVPTMEVTPKDNPGEKYIINVSAFDATKWIAWEDYRLETIYERARAGAAAGKPQDVAVAEAVVSDAAGEVKAPRGRPRKVS